MARRTFLFRKVDKFLLFAPVFIFMAGIVSIISTSFRADQTLDYTFVMRQLQWVGLGMLLVLLLIRVPYFKLLDFSWPFYFLSLFLLALVLFMPARLGAHRWIGVGTFSFQPSEIAKIAVIFVLAHFFSSNRIEYTPNDKRLLPFVIVLFPFLLILKEPDLGTGLTLIPVLLAMLYVWGLKPRYIFLLLLAAALVSPILFHFLKDYQKARLLVFINPNADPLGAGYTIIQSKIAIGSGGLFGRGVFGGTQTQLNFVPENHTDFIFASIAEEGGFMATCFILGLFLGIVQKGLSIASKTSDRFGVQLAVGITTMLAVQTIINIGMTAGVFPVVGIPLPLVSYGGSQLVITLLAIGLLINIKIYRPLF